MAFGWFSDMASRLRNAFDAGPESNADLPLIPEGRVVYAVGDVHGEFELLHGLLRLIEQDAQIHAPGLAPTLVFLGDYIDRGPRSRDVVELLSKGPVNGWTWYALRGNHEQALLDFLREPVSNTAWLSFGGIATLDSYGVGPPMADEASLTKARDRLLDVLPAAHRSWIDRLELCVQIGGYAFVHAGVRPGVPLDLQERDDLLWIRAPFLNHMRRFEKKIVHGHTITKQPDVLSNRIGIDTGSFAAGHLSAVALNGEHIRLLHSSRNGSGYWSGGVAETTTPPRGRDSEACVG
jgi:serine/threonine protein phosphatase 1